MPNPFHHLPNRLWSLLLFAVAGSLLVLLCGCQAYQFGSPSLHGFQVRTIHVPIFESDSYRRFLGQRLTEAVVKQIELNTPYTLADASTADSVLSGQIFLDRKRVLAESINDDPRDIEVSMLLEVVWSDRAGVPLMQRQLLQINRDTHFIPESGQSLTTAQQKLINRIARQIVNQMEAPW